VLVVEHLFGGYGKLTIIKDCNLIVETGESVALLGPNGSGKTTLLRCISGLLKPSQGKIQLANRDVTYAESYKRALLGMILVPDINKIFKTLTVFENFLLVISAFSLRDGKARIQRILDLFPNLAPLLKRRAGSLSGGEQQLLALAMAFLAQPKVLLLDEPSAGLMPKLVRNIKEILQTFKKQGISMLVAEQQISVIHNLVDKIMVMRNGQIVGAHLSSAFITNDLIQQWYFGELKNDLSENGREKYV